VAITQPPSVPALPSRSPWAFALIGTLLSFVVSAGLAITLDYMDQSFRTPSEVLADLNIPVLAAVPFHPTGRNGANGKNGHNGNGHNGNGRNGSRGHGIDEVQGKAGTSESDSTVFTDGD
jgi:hypothetical protein